MTTDPQTDTQKGPLERVLSVFADFRKGEGGTALMLTAAGFLLLLSYYLVKVAREPLIIAAGDSGAEWKTYAAGGQAVLLVFVLALYDWIYARASRMRLLSLTYGFFAVNLVLFYFLATSMDLSAGSGGGAILGISFYLWVGIFSVFVIAQFWSFANDIYTSEQGKRIFGFIAIGGTIGAASGSAIAKQVIVLMGDVFPVMLLGALVLLLTLGLMGLVNKREAALLAKRDAAEAAKPKAAEGTKDRDSGNGFKLVFSDKYLLYIALLILLLNWVNTTGEYVLDRYIKEAAAAAFAADGTPEKVFVGAFRGDFYTFVNICVIAMQALFVSRFIQHLGVRIALFVLPLVALVGYASLILVPILLVVKIAKIAENSVDYSLQNTAQQALWLKTSRSEKYKAKAVIDTFFKRGGDVLAALVVLLGSASILAFDLSTFIYINMGLVLVWLFVVSRLAKLHKERETAASA